AVVDRIAILVGRTDSQVIPMRGVNYEFVAQFRIASRKYADDVWRLHALHLALKVQLSFQVQCYWLEITRRGFSPQVVEVLPGKFHNFSRGIVRHPRAK